MCLSSVILDSPATSACEDGDVRLTHRQVTGAIGQVQICINQTWNRVRSGSTSWTDQAATVVCQQLGFIGEGEEKKKNQSESVLREALKFKLVLHLLQEVSLF